MKHAARGSHSTLSPAADGQLGWCGGKADHRRCLRRTQRHWRRPMMPARWRTPNYPQDRLDPRGLAFCFDHGLPLRNRNDGLERFFYDAVGDRQLADELLPSLDLALQPRHFPGRCRRRFVDSAAQLRLAVEVDPARSGDAASSSWGR